MPEDPVLNGLIDQWRRARDAKIAADEAAEKATEAIVAEMMVRGRKTTRTEIDGAVHKVSVVASERVKVDEVGLRKALGAKTYDKLVKRSLDQSLLRKAMGAGTVNPAVVAQFTEIVASRPYVKVTEEVEP